MRRIKNSSDIMLRNGTMISKEAIVGFLGNYLFFGINNKIGFGYCSGISVFISRNDSTIKIDVPHLNTSIEKYISDFEWLESINVSEYLDKETRQKFVH